jgi:hypothetical protein
MDGDDGTVLRRKRRRRSGRRKDGQGRVGKIGAKNGLMMELTGCIA